MTTFKAGDKVRLTGPSWEVMGLEGSIQEILGVDDEGDPFFKRRNGRVYFIFDPEYSAELVEPERKFQVGDRVTDTESSLMGKGTVIGYDPSDTRPYKVRFDNYNYHFEQNEDGSVDYESDWHPRKEEQLELYIVADDEGCCGGSCGLETETERLGQEEIVERIIRGYGTATLVDETNYIAGEHNWTGAPSLGSSARMQLRESFEPWHADYTDAVDPNHYKFPGGAEVISISQWLTANAAQAVQYICRSSRIDGKNKGDALEDIEKAIRFLTFEKERLRDPNN